MKGYCFSLPESCVVCGRYPVTGEIGPLCRQCVKEMYAMPGPFTLPVGTSGVTCYAATEYAGIAKRAIEVVKYSGNRRLVEAMGRILLLRMVSTLTGRHTETSFSCVVPVPASPRGRRSRGFDQAFLLAGTLNIPVETPLRRLGGLQQKRLARKDRLINAGKQYVLGPCRGNHPDFSVGTLLVDDVITTGASLERCIELLRSRGYNVSAAAVCTATL